MLFAPLINHPLVSDAEIFEAKVVILDILGWGVPAQYLLDCGISELAIVVCLSELKLRIPKDLEFLIDQAEHQVRTIEQQKSTATTTRPSTPLSAHATPFVPSPAYSPASSVDLNDIEQQRKRELLARRAVLQSMKKAKEALHADPPSDDSAMISVTDALPTPPIQDGEVDAFLAGLLPAGEDISMENGQANEAMEVEEALAAVEPDDDEAHSLSQPSPHITPPAHQTLSVLTSSIVPPSRDTASPDGSADSHTYPTRFLLTANQRRNGKRPVAAEYMPQDNASASTSRVGPTRSYTMESNGNGNGMVRRKTFGPTTQQRLVIEISDDDEAESHHGDEMEEDGVVDRSNAHSSHSSTPPAVTPIVQVSTSAEEQKAKLLEKKQREIELMREKIRRMEDKKRALAATVVTSPEQVEAAAASTPTPPLANNKILPTDSENGKSSLQTNVLLGKDSDNIH